MSFLGGSALYEDGSDIDVGGRQELPQSAIISMYTLPDASKANNACDADRSRHWLAQEGGARAAFLDARESAPDASSSLMCTWREHGLVSAVRQWIELNEGEGGKTTTAEESGKLTLIISKVLSLALSGFRFSTSIFAKLHPHHSLSPEEIIRQFSSCGPAWSQSKVRAIDWHPHTLKLAVASIDDALRVFYGGSASEKALVPTLKHPRQKNISCVKWRPLSASGLAVAAQDGIVLWKVDPNSLSSRPSSSCVTFLTWSGHRPVTSLAWSKDGMTLFSASPCDSRVISWDVSRVDGLPTPLTAITGGGVTHLSFSPSGKLLLTATPTSEFRVWNSGSDWSNEKWTNLVGRLKTSVWSPDGNTLLFATENDCVVYAVDFKTNWESGGNKPNSVQTAGEARAVLDLSQLVVEEGDGDSSFQGGSIHQLEWDSSGERIAIGFRPQTGHAGLVAIFSTRFRCATSGTSNVDFHPSGVIRGIDAVEEPYASSIAFCPKFAPGSEPPWSPGALLAVVWAVSGRISYHPLHFIPSVGAVGSTSVLNSTLATSKYQSVAGHVGDTSSLARGGAHGTSSLNAIPNNIFLNNSLSNSSFHNLNASKSCKSQLFSVQD